jgi:poly(hydroxyalkanoate) depolymerase family esterase
VKRLCLLSLTVFALLLAACSDDSGGPLVDSGLTTDSVVNPDGTLPGDGTLPSDGTLPGDGASTPDQGKPVNDATRSDSVDPDLGPRTAGDPVELKNFGSNPGNLKMWKTVPTNMPPKRPLIVALHACNNQNIKSYSKATGWNALAAKKGFYVLYPQTNTINNVQACFNWFYPSDASRGSGEAGSIKQGIDAMLAAHDIDPSRIYVSGFSAGAAMASAMLAVYPDVFAGGAIIAGVPFGCATGVVSAFTCMSGSDSTPASWGKKVFDATKHEGAYPKVAIFHGTKDSQVSFTNFGELIEQWTAVHKTDQTADRTDKIGNMDVSAFSAGGVEVVIGLRLNGFGHSYPQANPSAPELATQFWGL